MSKKLLVAMTAIFLAGGLILGTIQTVSASFTGAADITGFGGGNGYGNGGSGTQTGTGSACYGTLCQSTSLNLSTEPLSTAEENALLYMVEEEKLARDVYQFLAEKWNLAIFANIARSEQTHMNALITLIDRYGLTNPVSDQAGVFTNDTLQALYTELTAKGSQTLTDALLVGGAIEEIDIRDLKSDLEDVTHSDITQVFNNLMSGSYNHLQAFANEYELQTGKVYTPQYLDSLTFQEAIEASPVNGSAAASRGSGYGQFGRR